MVLIATSASIKTYKKHCFQYLQLARITKTPSFLVAHRSASKSNITFSSDTLKNITAALKGLGSNMFLGTLESKEA